MKMEEQHKVISDPWKTRFPLVRELLLAAAKAALPQEEILSVQFAFRHPIDNTFSQDLPPGCVRVEIIRPLT
jgi:hypothetical protein